MLMLTDICQNLHNWFDRFQPKWQGQFSISDDGDIAYTGKGEFSLKTGQYFRIIGSTFNDGVHQYPASDAVAEVFEGYIWAMAVPPSVVALASDIEKWIATYQAEGSANMSPYTSESFEGYSYSKGGGLSRSGATGLPITWEDVFASRLNMWRKLP